MNRSNNKVILDIETYQNIYKDIEELKNSDARQEILKLKTKIQDIEIQNEILHRKIKEQEKWHNLFFYEQSLRTQYEKALNKIASMPFSDRMFRYKSIINTIMKLNKI